MRPRPNADLSRFLEIRRIFPTVRCARARFGARVHCGRRSRWTRRNSASERAGNELQMPDLHLTMKRHNGAAAPSMHSSRRIRRDATRMFGVARHPHGKAALTRELDARKHMMRKKISWMNPPNYTGRAYVGVDASRNRRAHNELARKHAYAERERKHLQTVVFQRTISGALIGWRGERQNSGVFW